MHDTEFDELLHRSIEPLAPAVVEEVYRVADAAAPQWKPGKPWHKMFRFKVGLLTLGGAIVLTGGAGYAYYSMTHWSGVELKQGFVRNNEPIRVSFIDENGVTQNCRSYLTLGHAEPGDGAVLDEAIVAHDWEGLGQRLYDSAESVSTEESALGITDAYRITDLVFAELEDFVKDVFPGINWISEAAIHGQGHLTGRYVDEVGIDCEDDG